MSGSKGFLDHYHELIGTWTRKLRNRQEAEDLAHDAFVRVLEHAGESVEQPRAYLHRTARNIAVDGYRREDLRQQIEPDLLDESGGEDPEAYVRALELADSVEDALSELPPNCRRVFVWQKLEGLSQAEIADRMGLSRNMVERYMMRTLKHLRKALAPLIAALALGAGWFGWQYQRLNAHMDLVTAPGQRREFDLPDGSHLMLNGNTHLAVSFSAGQRDVRLASGEVMFIVAHDSGRPFVVQTTQGRVTVTGTRFDVRQDPAQTRVVVEQGSVRVQGAGDSRASLGAGQGSIIDAAGQVKAPAAVDSDALTAWRHGKLVFEDATLAEVVAEVSRYRAHPVKVTGKAADLRLSSTFSIDDPDALLRALPALLPVAVRTAPDGSAEIFAR